MEYDVRRRTLTLGRHACRRCVKGKVSTPRTCRRCLGDGKGPRGGANGCRMCSGNGITYDHVNRSTCDECGGEYEEADPERWTDRVPVRAMELIPITVVRVGRSNTFNEDYLGFGYLYSATDYGQAAGMDDDDLIEKVRAHLMADPPQGTKVVGDVGEQRRKIADRLVVTVTRNGYSVKAVGLVTRPVPAKSVEPPRPQRPIGEHPANVCDKCHLVHVVGECGE